MRQADVIAVTIGALLAIWLVRTGRLQRLAGTASDPVMKAFEATGSTGAFPAPSLTLPGISSQKGRAIGERARTFIGASSAQFNPQFPRRACASFVSEILVSLGLMSAEDPRCRGIVGQLPGLGARRIASGPAGTTPTQVGDLIFFRDGGGVIRHVEIAVGGGRSVGTSSSQQRVGERPIGSRGFPTIDVFRF